MTMRNDLTQGPGGAPPGPKTKMEPPGRRARRKDLFAASSWGNNDAQKKTGAVKGSENSPPYLLMPSFQRVSYDVLFLPTLPRYYYITSL